MYMNYIVTILDKNHVVEYLTSLVACGFNTDIEVDKPLKSSPNSCAKFNNTTILVMNSLQLIQYIITMRHLMRAWNVFHCIILLRL